jgi:hypothetical protein
VRVIGCVPSLLRADEEYLAPWLEGRYIALKQLLSLRGRQVLDQVREQETVEDLPIIVSDLLPLANGECIQAPLSRRLN